MGFIMKKYVYNRPLLKRSTAPILLKDERDQAIGSIRKTYKNKMNRALSWAIDHWELSLKGEDLQAGTSVEIVDGSSWFGRKKWTVTVTREGGESVTSTLRDQSKIATHPKFELVHEGQTYTVSKDLLNRTTRILNSNGNAIICEMKNVSFGKGIKREIVMHGDALCPIFAACLDHLFHTLY